MKTINEAALEYCTDRDTFVADPINERDVQWLNALFLGANTRPELAETIAMLALGYVPLNDKHGFDGLKGKRPIEGKIRTTDTERLENSKSAAQFTSITINDPTDNIIRKYDKADPLFVFAYFIDGHLVACFSSEWKDLRPLYVKGVSDIKKAGNGRRNFSLTTGKWLEKSAVVYKHKDPSILDLMPNRNVRKKLGLPTKRKS